MSPLMGADLEQFGRNDTVEPGPVKPCVGVMHFAGHCRHKRDAVRLATRERGDPGKKAIIVGLNGSHLSSLTDW